MSNTLNSSFINESAQISSNLSLFHLLPVLHYQFSLVAWHSIRTALLQDLHVRPDVLFQLTCALEVNCFRLIINPAVFKDLHDIVTKLIPISIFAITQLLFDAFEVDRLLNN